MAANFQHNMGGQGQMMPQQRQQQQQQQQQRPQPAGTPQQIQSLIFNTLNSQTGPLSGWQAGVLPNERMGLIFNIIGNLRLASQHQPNPPTIQRMVEIGLRFEKDIFDKSVNKEVYKRGVQAKLEQLLERRNQNQATLQQQINQQAQNQAQNQQTQALMLQQNAQQHSQAQAQQMMLNQQNGMLIQGQRPMPLQGNPQQPFSHLQHQMQASPLPGQQQPQAPMGMPNQNMQQNMSQNQQQQQLQANLAQQQAQQLAAEKPIGGQLTQQENQIAIQIAAREFGRLSEDEKAAKRAQIVARMDPVSLQRWQAQGVDPVQAYIRNQANTQVLASRQARMNQQLAMGQHQPPNMSSAAPPMQPQRSVNPSPLPGQVQPTAPMGVNPDFGSFMGNMENTAAQQQQQGVIAEQAGQMVVPVSGAPRNSTPQPGNMVGPPNNLNDPRNMGNPNMRAQQQQQQILHAQQMQQRIHLQQQSQAQTQARLNAQNKAQQIGLQGQPGGMGSGPIPPQQSPAMATLNAPMRTPSQQMNHPDAAQVNPATANFGAPLDPRFMQGNQRQVNPGQILALAGVNPAMFQNMALEKQQQIASLPPDKLQEVIAKWTQSRAAQGMGLQMPDGRPQMGMQGNGQARPGQQMPQGAQFNPQAAANQFAAQNSGQRAPPTMINGMNVGQQLALNQPMANMRPNQMQQRGMPMNQDQHQQALAHMDRYPLPQFYFTHQQMPQNFPPDLVKSWGDLKRWVVQAGQSLGLAPNTMDLIKQLQTLHYRSVLNQKRQQQMNTQAGQQGLQNSNPTIPPGMAAPVAPMGPNPIQMPNGMAGMPGQVRQPSAQEIQNIRANSNGKMNNMSDEQIRAYYMRSMHAQAQQQGQMSPQQQQQAQQTQRAHMMQQMQLQRAQQANAQTNQQAGQQQSNPQQQQPQPRPAPVAPPKQVQQANEAASANVNNANVAKNARPQQSSQGQAQNSSPALPQKNLKRASSSDDVVEVPNPNTSQARPTQAPTQAPGRQPQGYPTPAQIAAFDPEQKKKYEQHLLRMQQSNDPVLLKNVQSKLDAIRKEEEATFREGPVVAMDEQARTTFIKELLRFVDALRKVSPALSKWFIIFPNVEMARNYYRAELQVKKQFKDPEMRMIKTSFSMTFQEVEKALKLLTDIVMILRTKFPSMVKAEPAKSQSAAAQPSQPAPPTPLNAANLHHHQQQQQLLKHQRSNSKSSHPPAAPTSTHAPFQFGAPSPHGLPAYSGNSKITQENLHIPARKKQKPNGTPGSNASPQVTKAASPEIKRQGEPKQQPKPTLTCGDPECDRHNTGFETQQALDKHNEEEHVRPLQDSASFVKENLAMALGLDSEGRAKQTPAPTSQGPPAGAMMVPSGSKQGQTPNMKTEPGSATATPMHRQVSMNRQGSAMDNKANVQVKSGLAQDASAKLQTVQKEANTPAQHDNIIADLWANSTLDPNDLHTTFGPFETGAGGAISDMSVYRSITPNDTPESSKDGVSEPNSDISEGVGLDISLNLFDPDWQPFGAADTDNLMSMDTYMYSGGDEDMTMFDDQPMISNNWDDLVDQSQFDKPFEFDSSLYSMRAD